MKKLLQSWLLISLGVLIAAHTSSGIRYDSMLTLVVIVVLLSAFNLILKPLLIFFTLPFVIVSMGLSVWLVNALLLMLAGKVVTGFKVASFWSALWGALVISLTSLVINLLLYGRLKVETKRRTGTSLRSDDNDVIDI